MMHPAIPSNDALRAAVKDYLAHGEKSDAHATYGPIADWDVSRITDMSRLFAEADDFSADLSRWDVCNVTDMGRMFSYATAFTSDLSKWNVDSVTDMERIFEGATAFTSDLSKWDVGNVTNMSGMFAYASEFKSDLSTWDVGKVTDMSGMFYEAEAFTSDLGEWNVGNVTNMSDMFAYATAFRSDLSQWIVGNVTDMGGMFFCAHAFASDLSKWDVGNVTDMNGMFNGATAFTSDLSKWDVRNVTTMGSMFYEARAFTSDLSRWDVRNVTLMNGMFYEAEAFTSDLSRWDVGKVTNMRGGMFWGAKVFTPPLVPLPGGRGWTYESLAKHRAHWRWVRLRALFRTAQPVAKEWRRLARGTRKRGRPVPCENNLASEPFRNVRIRFNGASDQDGRDTSQRAMVEEWLQCDRCAKWRRCYRRKDCAFLFRFVCTDNTDARHATCDAPQELTDMEIDRRLGLVAKRGPSRAKARKRGRAVRGDKSSSSHPPPPKRSCHAASRPNGEAERVQDGPSSRGREWMARAPYSECDDSHDDSGERHALKRIRMVAEKIIRELQTLDL